MTDWNISFPSSDDQHFPPPVLTLDQYRAWVIRHWTSLSDDERCRALQESWLEHCGERFSLDEHAA